MLPPKIDLTAHRDFGHDGFILLSDDLDRLLDADAMTSDDYEAVKRHEEIFGRRRHRNEARNVFSVIYDIPFDVKTDWSRTCVRCGRPLFPWNNLGGICNECDKELNQSYGFGNVPWYAYNIQRTPNNIMDIFNLR